MENLGGIIKYKKSSTEKFVSYFYPIFTYLKNITERKDFGAEQEGRYQRYPREIKTVNKFHGANKLDETKPMLADT